MGDSIALLGFFIGIVVAAIGVVVLCIVQVVQVPRELLARRAMRHLQAPVQPWVTVLIDARNGEAAGLKQTLRSLKRNRYAHYNSCIVNDADTESNTLRRAYRQNPRGEYVIIVQAGDELPSTFIKQAVSLQDGREHWRAPVRNTLGNELQLSDIATLLEKHYWQAFRSAQVFRASYFLQWQPRVSALRYDAAMRQAVSILLFLCVVAAVFLTQSLLVVWYAWLLVVAYGAVVIVLRRGEPLREKVVLLCSLPLSLFLLPAVGIVRGFVHFHPVK